MGAASQFTDHGTPDEAVRSNSIERQRRLRGDCYQGFSDEQEEEGEPSFRLDLGVGERLAQVPEVSTQLLSGNMQLMPKQHTHTHIIVPLLHVQRHPFVVVQSVF